MDARNIRIEPVESQRNYTRDLIMRKALHSI